MRTVETGTFTMTVAEHRNRPVRRELMKRELPVGARVVRRIPGTDGRPHVFEWTRAYFS